MKLQKTGQVKKIKKKTTIRVSLHIINIIQKVNSSTDERVIQDSTTLSR